jgi:hypothetical protein
VRVPKMVWEKCALHEKRVRIRLAGAYQHVLSRQKSRCCHAVRVHFGVLQILTL